MSNFNKQIKIFLASSIVEFKNERSELVLFINELSNLFEKNYNIKIKPIYCESIDPCMEKGRKTFRKKNKKPTRFEPNRGLLGIEMSVFAG